MISKKQIVTFFSGFDTAKECNNLSAKQFKS